MISARLQSLTLEEDSTVDQAVQKIIDGRLRGLVVVKSDLKVVGTLTEGDLLRAMRRGLDLRASVMGCVNLNYSFLNAGEPLPKREEMLQGRHLILPVVDHNMVLLDVVSIFDG